MQRLRIFTFMFTWALMYLQGSGQVDSLLQAYVSSTDPKAYTALVNQICQRCDTVESCFKPFLTTILSEPVSEKKVQGIFTVAGHYYFTELYPQAVQLYLLGISKSKSLDPNFRSLPGAYNTLGNLYKYINHLDSALYYTDLSDAGFRALGLERSYWRPHHVRYQIYLELKDFKRADMHIRNAYQLVRNSPNRADKGFVLFSLLQALEIRGSKEEFNFYLDEFIRFKAEGKQNPLDGRHLGLEEFFDSDESGIQVLQERIRLALLDSLNYSPDLTLLTLAEKFEAAGKYDQALEQLDFMQEKTFPSVTAQKSRYHRYFNIYKKMNQPDKAYKALDRYMTFQDSSYQQILKNNIAEYEVKYEVEQQQRKIIEQDLALTRSKMVQRSYVGISGLLLLAGLTGVVIHRRKLKYQRDMSVKEAELQAQRIKDLEQKNMLLSLNSLIEGQEAERMRIAQDLHDGLGGLLTTVKAHFNSIQREIENIRSLNVYEKTNQLIDEACVEVRRIAHDMIPYSIKISGLEGALEDLKQSIIARGPNCELEIHHVDTSLLTEQKANMIYRIIQEITNNSVKHANASKIFIQLMQHETTLHVLVEDNGKGFDINQVVSNRGMGLKSIDSRVSYLGGKVNYDTAPGLGTTVNIEIPLTPLS